VIVDNQLIMNKKHKIVSRIFGGIGNQLFCYAAARRLAIVCNAELVIDDVSGFAYDELYQRNYQLDNFSIPCSKATANERLEPFSRLRRYVKRAYNLRFPFTERTYIQETCLDFDLRLLKLQPRGTVYLDGYWQSEGYFKDVDNTIRQDLKIKFPVDEANSVMASLIRASLAVAVHVRFFDAPNNGGSNNLLDDYYASAVARMEALVPGAHYFVFSDRPEDARASISLPENRITFVTHNQGDTNAYADLWLMTLCKHFIIANSTFSWWGAWLAAEVGKQVIAPAITIKGKSQVTAWGFRGLIPKAWIKI
jgi:hypothetical protein